MRWRKVTKVTNPISDFTFLSTAKFGKSRIKNPFLDSPKGTHPEILASRMQILALLHVQTCFTGLGDNDVSMGRLRGTLRGLRPPPPFFFEILYLLFHPSYSTNSVKPKPGAYTACGLNDRNYFI